MTQILSTITKTWFNAFGEYAYQLENGDVVYINASNTQMRVVKAGE